jgi:hypothetical protein
MKKITLIVAAVVVMAVLSVSCNNYVCPAYSHDADQEQNDEVES